MSALPTVRDAAAEQDAPTDRFAFAGVVLIAVWIAVVVRLPHLLDPFPLGDGGMFASIIQDLLDDGLSFPTELSYNQSDLPFAYPPLGFYLAATLAHLFGTTPDPWLVVLPAAASLLSVCAFALVARRLSSSVEVAGLAVIIFALIPRSYSWEIIGGGLTRSFGFLFALLALHQALRMYDDRARWAWQLSGLFMALAVLSHLEFAWFGAFMFALFLVAQARDRRRAAIDTVKAAAVCLVLTLPWIGLVVRRHGLDPFLQALSASNNNFFGPLQLLTPNSLGEPLLPVFLGLGLLGAVRCGTTGRWLLPLMVLVMFMLDPRKAQTYATIPVALLAAIAIWEVLLPMLRTGDGRASLTRPQKVMLSGVVGFGILAALASGTDGWSPLARVPEQNRDAMEWIEINTEQDARFVVITGERRWWLDITSEWFPAIASRHSVATVQGTEWTDRFHDLESSSDELQRCASQGVRCLDGWADSTQASFDHLYLPFQFKGSIDRDNECCAAMRHDLQRDSRFEEIYSGEGGSIFRVR